MRYRPVLLLQLFGLMLALSCASQKSVLVLAPEPDAPPEQTLKPDDYAGVLRGMASSFRACGVSPSEPADFYVGIEAGAVSAFKIGKSANPDCLEAVVRGIPRAPAARMDGTSFFVSLSDDGVLSVMPLLYGSLTKRELYQPIAAAQRELQRCGEASHAVGEVVIRWTVQGDGSVSDTRVVGDAGNAEAGRCLRAVVSKLGFRAPRGGGIVHVTYPFVFELLEGE